MLYEPREDSYLLQQVVRREAFGSVLDVGTGTGIQAETALKCPKVTSVTAVDINPEAVQHCKKITGVKCWRSNLFSALGKGVFDTIIFNAPYLPQQGKKPDIAVEGGKKGYETIEQFLKQAPEHLSSSGTILLAFSSLTNRQKVEQLIATNLLEFSIAASQHVSFEDLFVYKIVKSNALVQISRKATFLQYFAKGKRSIVLTGSCSGKKIAVKVRNSKSPKGADREAEMLSRVNKLGIGPKLLFSGREYIAYEFVQGTYLKDYLPKATRSQMVYLIKQVLKQCRTLDDSGISKEEMHRPLKHIIINRRKVTMIDFERSHFTTKPNSVLQWWEYVRRIIPELKKKGLTLSSEKMILAGRQYGKTHRLSLLLKVIDAK